MKSKANGAIKKAETQSHVQAEGHNWIFIAGGVLLSTLTVKLGRRLKQMVDSKRQLNAIEVNRKAGGCQLHADLYRLTADNGSCYFCISGAAHATVDDKETTKNTVCKEADSTLPLVNIHGPEYMKENGGMMLASSSPDRFEPFRKPLRYSNSSSSLCASESGSDIYTKREVIQKLRQQLKRRDEMILEMQAQLTDLKNSLSTQVTQSANLQSQVYAANRDLFESEKEIQRLRKIIADHCVAEALSSDKQLMMRSWHSELSNGHTNGYDDSINGLELHCASVEKRKGDGEKVEMLKKEVEELKEVIGGKDFLLQNYKEQKAELSLKVKELQVKLESQVPNMEDG